MAIALVKTNPTHRVKPGFKSIPAGWKAPKTNSPSKPKEKMTKSVLAKVPVNLDSLYDKTNHQKPEKEECSIRTVPEAFHYLPKNRKIKKPRSKNWSKTAAFGLLQGKLKSCPLKKAFPKSTNSSVSRGNLIIGKTRAPKTQLISGIPIALTTDIVLCSVFLNVNGLRSFFWFLLCCKNLPLPHSFCGFWYSDEWPYVRTKMTSDPR